MDDEGKERLDRYRRVKDAVEARATERMNALAQFNPGRECPKCRFDSVSTEYCLRVIESDFYLEHSLMLSFVDIEAVRGVMVRVCAQCRFEWFERPVDYEAV